MAILFQNYQLKWIYWLLSPQGNVTASSFIGTIAQERSNVSFNTWGTEYSASISSTTYGASVDGRIAVAKSLISDFGIDLTKKHVRIRLLARRTTGAGTLNLANITFETGRPLGGVVT
jgi:hypothetical protein